MKFKINPEKELFKWGPLEFRLIYGSPFINCILSEVKKYYPWSWAPGVCLFKNGKMIWIQEQLATNLVGLKYFKKYFLDLKNYKLHWRKWENWIKQYEKTAKKLEKLNFNKLTDKEMYSYLDSFYKLNINFWLIVQVPEVANWGGEHFLRKKLQKYKDKAEEYLEILSSPVKFSFFQQEELDLLELASIKKEKESKKMIKEHAKKYCWLLNSYGGNRILKPKYFESRLKELLKEKKAETLISKIREVIKNNRRRKMGLIKKLKSSEEIVLIAEQLSQSIWWQDLRKGYIWRMNYFWDKFLKEICLRKKWNFNEILYCQYSDLADIAKGRRVDKKEILKRKNYYAIYFNGNRIQHFSDEKFIKKLFDLYSEVKISEKEEIKGLVVSKGKDAIVKGRVKIIENPFKDNKKMQKGDILVAGMTSPEYIVVMKKAKAIITDHGGMTSHAAIVSRELGVLCIVNTKIATKVLKDGDLIEVDAEKGVIRKIK